MHFQSATQLLAALNRREIGSRELLNLYLARIERHNPHYNAVVALDIDQARAAASEIDDRRARQQPLGPLAGLPMTIKDTFEVVGMPATSGVPALAGHRPERDADAIARLRKAGAILFGKTNTPTMAADFQSNNPVYGLTRNPWNPDRTPGGSSGGAAAALAAGFSGAEFGSDIGGSIRVPSHYCGVYGHKPSWGIVPTRGHIPPMPGVLFASIPLNVVGPLARSAEDLRLLLDVVAGPRELDGTAWSLKLPPSRHERLQDFRVGVWTGGGQYPVDEAYLEAIDGWVQDLRRAGAAVDDRVKPPFDPQVAFDIYLRALFMIFGAVLPPEELAAVAEQAAQSSDPTAPAVRLDRIFKDGMSAWIPTLERRERLFVAFREFFTSHDVLICPVTMTVAFPHIPDGRLSAQTRHTLSVSGKAEPYFNNLMWPGVATNANLPATAVPTGRRVAGLPAGVQIIGPYLEDLTTIRFAELVERELGGFEPPPTIM